MLRSLPAVRLFQMVGGFSSAVLGEGAGEVERRDTCVCVCVHVCMCACMCACVLQRKAKKERDCVLLPTVFPEGLPVADAQ